MKISFFPIFHTCVVWMAHKWVFSIIYFYLHTRQTDNFLQDILYWSNFLNARAKSNAINKPMDNKNAIVIDLHCKNGDNPVKVAIDYIQTHTRRHGRHWLHHDTTHRIGFIVHITTIYIIINPLYDLSNVIRVRSRTWSFILALTWLQKKCLG